MTEKAEQLRFAVEGREVLLLRVDRHPEPTTRLTASERNVVTHLLRGHTYRDIAEARGTSVHTVANQARSVYRKIGIHCRWQLSSRLAEHEGTRIYHRVLQGGTHCSTIRTRLRSLGTSLEAYPLLEETIRNSGADDFWGKIGTHIAAGHRLRRRMAEAPAESQAAAILSPDGCALELSEKAVPHQDVLRRAVRALDRAKARDFKTGSSETIDLWNGLIGGEWSLVDRVDTDGKRYVLAIRNDPNAPAPHPLSRREAQIATYIAQGRSHKEVSYELGIAVSTVGTHLRNALDKLGLSSHTELAWLYGAVRVVPR